MNEQELYRNLNAEKGEDLLRHFPTRYESLLETPIPSEPYDGQRIVVSGRATNIKNIPASRVSLVRFQISKFGHILNCLLYGQDFYLNRLYSRQDSLFVLYYSLDRKTWTLQAMYDMDSQYVRTGIRPVYSLPKSVPVSYFTSVLKRLVSKGIENDLYKSDIPPFLVEKYRLLDENNAYRAIHFPRNTKDLNEGLRVFKYEEALEYSVKSIVSKNMVSSRKKPGVCTISHNAVNDFIKRLPYKLTKDQTVAIREIITDMEQESVMYRLLQGDVSTGKTAVAFTALYGNWLRGKQGVMMAPTYELARQHYLNALDFFKNEDITVDFLASDATPKERKSILERLQAGISDILIATHSAISKEVKFRDLGLAVIDEQQLFGVQQREELMNKGNADLLMLSATPIPRTLSQIVNGDVDVSTLTEFPTGERKVKSKVIRSTDPVLLQAIEKALAAKRQIFIVAPRIEGGENSNLSAESVYAQMIERFGEENCQLMHGKIKKEERQLIYSKFVSGEKLILVSTTVIEVGVDVSRAGLLVVYEANYFGLSTLHQLRGRIGRSGEFALCLLVYDGNDKEAKDKLDFLADNSNGLDISQYDLKTRGAGSYSGSRQSGTSELTVCNFVNDSNIFMAAKKDAQYLLENPDIGENRRYLRKIHITDDFKIV